MSVTLALVGAPNTGKSTLFNALCAACVPTGNREGVTVQAVHKKAKGLGMDWEVVDLPGIRTLPPRAPDEQLSLSYLQSIPPELIVFVVDVTRASQGLALCFDLLRRLRQGCTGCGMSCGAQTTPMRCMLVLNYCDRLETRKIKVHTQEFSGETGIPAVAVSAVRGQGMQEFLAVAQRVLRSPVPVYRLPQGQAQIDCLVELLLGENVSKRLEQSLADRIFARRLTGIPVFLVLFGLILWLCMGGPGKWASEAFLRLTIDPLVSLAERLSGHVPSWLVSLLCDGVLTGAGTVLSFLPSLSLLFACLCILEQSGLLARCAYVMHRPMQKIGLSGQGFVALLLGVGCSVPGVMSLRTVANAAQRRRAAVLLPLISCTARLPVYLMIGSMCGLSGWGICIVAYLVGIVGVCAWGAIMAKGAGDSNEPPLALPPYRMPGVREVVRQVRERSFDFVVRVGSTVLLCSVLVWLLSHLTWRLGYTEEIKESLLGLAGQSLAPLLVPIGLGKGEVVSALMCGVLAKESIVATLGVLSGGEISGMLNTAQAMAFAVFCALYCPCVATLGAMKREAGSVWATVQSILIGLGSAYFAAAVTYYGVLLCQKFLA